MRAVNNAPAPIGSPATGWHRRVALVVHRVPNRAEVAAVTAVGETSRRLRSLAGTVCDHV